VNSRQENLSYDAAGHVIGDGLGQHTFNARGARVLVTTGAVGGGLTGHASQPAEEDASTFDGNAQLSKLVITTRDEELIGEGPQTSISESVTPTYYLRSSVMKGYVIDEIDPQGQKTKGYIYAAGERLAEHVTTPSYNTIHWQHKNPMTGSWIEVSADAQYRYGSRREMDPMGREVGTEAPANPPEEPPESPKRSPMYIENTGGQTSEAELGMQLYEDFYINKIYGGGAGPGQGGFWDQWNKHVHDREGQLMAGGHFLFGIDKMNASLSGNQYELIEDGQYTSSVGEDEDGNPVVNIVWKDLSYYRLVPGSGAPQNTTTEKSRVGAKDLKAYKARIEDMIQQKKCGDYIGELLNEVKTHTGRSFGDILTTFDEIRFYWANTGGSHGGKPYWEGMGTVRAADIMDTINTEKMGGSRANQIARRGFLISETTQAFLGETLHHVSRGGLMYGDGEMANALNAILVRKGLDSPKVFSDLTVADVDNASRYWHRKVASVCPAPRK
jgi:uncharacterized protein YcfJ